MVHLHLPHRARLLHTLHLQRQTPTNSRVRKEDDAPLLVWIG